MADTDVASIYLKDPKNEYTAAVDAPLNTKSDVEVDAGEDRAKHQT